MRSRIIYLFFAAIFIYSCDPEDNRMVFKNNSEENVFVRMIFSANDSVERTAVNSKRVDANEEYRVVRLFSWESEFDNSSDGILKVVVFNDYKFLSDNKGFKKDIKGDSLLSIGNYQVKSYTYDELKRQEWKIIYPDDGFERGKPLILDNVPKPKRTPSPEILKEKGIRDRWNKKDSL